MTREEYYIAPSEEIFNDIKKNAIKIWQTYSNEFGYVDEKVNYIKRIQNIDDNAWTIVALFDTENMFKLLNMVKFETREKLKEVFRFGGYI